MRAVLVAMIVMTCALPSAPSAAAPRQRASFHDYQVGTFAKQVVIADFDGDLIPDLASSSDANLYCYGIVLLKGIGDGTFTVVDTLTPYACGGLAGADLDDDGDVDLVTAGSVWLGNGDLSFTPSSTFDPWGDLVQVADVTGDTIPDVVVPGPGAVRVLPGLGDGTLDAPIDVPATGLITGLATGDFDGNGHRDIVINTFADSIQVFLNGGGAVFAAPAVYPSPHVNSAVVAARIDGDAVLDLVAGLSWMKGNPDGTFDAAVPYGNFSPFQGVVTCVTDLDDDGANDIVSITSETGARARFAAQLGDGAGNFAAPSFYGTGTGAWRASAGDVNGDGDPDLVVACQSYGQIAVHLGHGDGTFDATLDYGTPGDPVDVEVAEVTGDTHADVMALCPSTATVRLLPNLGDGTLGAPVDLATLADPRHIVLGDVDDDGRVDLVIANGGSNSVAVFRSLPGGGFGARTDHAASSVVLDVAVADLDGDLIGDVVALGASGTVSVWPGQSGAGLGARVDHAFGLPTSTRSRVFAGNLTGDAALDVAVLRASGSPASWYVLPGTGGGGLGAPIPLAITGIPAVTGALAADVNDDDVLDLLVCSLAYLVVHIADGGGAFTALPLQGLPGFHRRSEALAVAYIDDDAHVDLVTGSGHTRVAGVHFGDGAGGFELEHGYGAAGWPLDVAVGDLDGDGTQDLVAANEYASNVTVMLGNPLTTAGLSPSAVTGTGLAVTRLWPVPASAVLHASLRIPSAGTVTLELLDTGGRRVARRVLGSQEAGLRQASLDLPRALRPGVYWLRLSDGAGAASARVVILH